MPPLAMAAIMAPSCHGRHGDAFAEGTHAADTALRERKLVGRDRRRAARRGCVAGEFAEAELVSVMLDALEAEGAAEGFEVEIVGGARWPSVSVRA